MTYSVYCTSDYIWYPLVGLILGSLLTVAFLFQIVHKFHSIIRLHSTISSYCSDPRGFGNRFLLCLTFLVAYNHVDLLIQEQILHPFDGWNRINFYLQMVADFLLPLVGVFYTSGHGMVINIYYELGPYVRFPILYSESIHSVCALGWMVITVVLNIEYGYLAGSDSYFAVSIVQVLIFITFIVTQGIIEFYGVEQQFVYGCPDCDSSTVWMTRNEETLHLSDASCRRCMRVPNLLQPSMTWKEGATLMTTELAIVKETAVVSNKQVIQTSSYLFAISFVTEALTVILASGLAYWGCILRIQKGCD